MATAAAGPPKVLRPVVWSLPSVRWAVLAVTLFLAGLATQLLDAPEFVWWTAYLACYVAGGWMPARDGMVELAQRRLDVDLLMIVAAVGAAAIGQVFDGALLIVIFATSGALEDLATRRTEDSVRALLDLAPERAVRVDEEGEQAIAAEALRVGDLVLVRPGERIPPTRSWWTGRPMWTSPRSPANRCPLRNWPAIRYSRARSTARACCVAGWPATPPTVSSPES